MTLLADVCASLGDVERAPVLYERLLPHAERNAFGKIEIAFGSVGRPLGRLAATLGQTELAIEHLESAIAMNERMGARPWVAHARFDLGCTLAQVRDPRSFERAGEQVGVALGLYRALGMLPWARKAE